MGIDDRILRKWTKKLAGSLEPGERVIAFDRGREEAVLRKRIDVVVSTHATYIGMGFGKLVRVSHDDVIHIQLAGANGIMLTTRQAQSLDQPGWCIYTNHISQGVPDHIYEQWRARHVQGADGSSSAPPNEQRRWELVSRYVDASESHLSSTATKIRLGPDAAAAGFVVATDQAAYVAATSEPFGTELAPQVVVIPYEKTDRVLMSDDQRWLVLVGTTEHGTSGSTTLQLSPSALSWDLACTIRGEWERISGKAAEGNWTPPDWPSAELSARGTFVPLLSTEQDQGGAGEVCASSDGVRFVTDNGVDHDYPWDWYDSYEVDPANGELRMHTKPGDGAFIRFIPKDRSAWINLLESRGLKAREP